MVMTVKYRRHLSAFLEDISNYFGIAYTMGAFACELLVHEDQHRALCCGQFRIEPIKLSSGQVGIGPVEVAVVIVRSVGFKIFSMVSR
jgi:hypothetical protein